MKRRKLSSCTSYTPVHCSEIIQPCQRTPIYEKISAVEDISKMHNVEQFDSEKVNNLQTKEWEYLRFCDQGYNPYLANQLHELQADMIVKAKLEKKLSVIRKQTLMLRGDTLSRLQDIKEFLWLNQASCNFRKVPGSIYYLYKKSSGEEYLSMLSPQDWDNRPPHRCMGSYKFDSDLFWTKID